MNRRNPLLVGAIASALFSISLAAPGEQPASESSASQPIVPPTPPPLPPVPEAALTQPATAPGLLPTPPTQPAATEPLSLPLAVPAQPSSQPATAAAAAAPPPPQFSLTQPAATQPNSGQETQQQVREVLVTGDLDRKRDLIAPPLGADTYTIGPNQIQNVPGGENAPFQQQLLRAPGVVEDSFGQLHVRGEHNNLTYRVNGVLLPEGLNGFGQELDTRIISTVTLIDGSLPAQFGFRTAGIIDVQTKSGATLNNNEFSLYGGSFNTGQAALQVGGSDKKLDYFAVVSYKYDDLGIENPTSSYDAIHDTTQQEKLFTYLAYRLDDTSRVTLLLNASYADFQIPNVPGTPPAFTLNNISTFDSSKLNENQNEQDYYGVLSYQHSDSDVSVQISGYTRYGQINYNGDPVGDLVLQGVAGHVFNSFLTNGIQADLSYIIDEHHTLRAGLIADYTSEQLFTTTSVFPVDTSGAQASTTPLDIPDDSRNWGVDSGIYVQDEWRLTPKLTVNYGLRYDRFDANFENADQLSPRINAVYKIDDKTTAHIGYSRYFAPPPVQYVHPSTLAKFAGTTNAPATFQDDPTPVERSNYYDLGASRQFSPAWQVNVDGFYKDAKDLNDLGQFGNAIILSPYSYHRGYVVGSELSTTYKQDGLSLFGNFAYVLTGAHNVNSSQYQFDLG